MASSPAFSPESGDPVTARHVARGIARLFARNDIWCLAEMPLRSGRRADLMGDGKWTDYLDHCDRFFWGLAPGLDRTCMEGEAFRPDQCGLIVGDGYDAEILRPAVLAPLSAARRKAEVERLARTALRRQAVAADPWCAGWGEFTT